MDRTGIFAPGLKHKLSTSAQTYFPSVTVSLAWLLLTSVWAELVVSSDAVA